MSIVARAKKLLSNNQYMTITEVRCTLKNKCRIFQACKLGNLETEDETKQSRKWMGGYILSITLVSYSGEIRY